LRSLKWGVWPVTYYRFLLLTFIAELASPPRQH